MSGSSLLRHLSPVALLASTLLLAPAVAAQDPHEGHSQHAGHSNTETTQTAAPLATQSAASTSREPIPAITDADRAAAFPEVDHHAMQHAPAITSLALIDRLEGWQRDGQDGQAWEAQAWVGNDLNRVWLRTEGERSGGHTQAAQTELLYGRSVSPWWDVVAGVRHDTGPADARSWAALGVQGLAPYKFEVAATAYLAEDGQIAATVEAEYELLLTHRLILQPRVEARLNGRDRVQFHESVGLSSLEAGLRLRYEVTRRFAPYVGISHGRHFGDAARWDEEHGESSRETHYVVGVRLWF